MLLRNLFRRSSPVDNPFKSDASFDRLYPEPVRSLSRPHWTPLAIARAAADFLGVTPGAKILDLGSGVGKFCLAAAHYRPECFFFGIEQRLHLIDHAEALRQRLQINNVSFLHGNLTDIDFSDYSHFYFFNSFYENLQEADKIDFTLDHSEDLYHFYNKRLFEELSQRPAGTRLCTYFGTAMQVPSSYFLKRNSFDGKLRFWIKG